MFGIACLAVVAVAVLVGAAVWAVRRRLYTPRHRRLSTASRQPFHDRENPAYSETEQSLSGRWVCNSLISAGQQPNSLSC